MKDDANTAPPFFIPLIPRSPCVSSQNQLTASSGMKGVRRGLFFFTSGAGCCRTELKKTKDLSGCRAEYLKAGLKRGEHMSALYSDVYSCRMTHKGHSVMAKRDDEAVNFKHILKPFKVGVIVYDMEPIKRCFADILKRHAEHKPDKAIIKVKKTRK